MNKFQWMSVSVDKRLVRQNLDYIVMKMLKEHDLHGYGFITYLRKHYGFYFAPSVIYPILNELKTRGCVVSHYDFDGERPRKVYTLTDKGVAVLRTMDTRLNAIRGKDINVSCLVDVLV